MKVGIYNANLHTMGGGEKHMGAIAEYLSRDNQVDILCTKEVDKSKMEKKLNLDFSNVNIRSYPELEHDDDFFSEKSKEYDIFINSTYFSRLKNQSALGIYLTFFPWREPKKYPRFIKEFSYNILSKIYGSKKRLGLPFVDTFYRRQVEYKESREYIETYELFLANSKYTQRWIKKELGVDSKILYPPIEVDEFKPGEKKNYILSVGRFFVHSHNKKQLEMIKIFKKMYDQNIVAKDYEYHLCGGVEDDELCIDYFEKCKKEAEGYPVFIHDNASFETLKQFYAESKIFWHASGFGENERLHPDRFEHFGMTTVEAMSAGVVPVVIAKGGQVEIVEDSKNGYIWSSETELIRKTLSLISDDSLVNKMSKESIIKSRKYSKQNMIDSLGIILKNFKR